MLVHVEAVDLQDVVVDVQHRKRNLCTRDVQGLELKVRHAARGVFDQDLIRFQVQFVARL